MTPPPDEIAVRALMWHLSGIAASHWLARLMFRKRLEEWEQSLPQPPKAPPAR